MRRVQAVNTSVCIPGFFIACCLLVPVPGKAQTVADLQQQIDVLESKVEELQQDARADRRITFRQKQRFVELQPGEVAYANLLCPIGKVAVSGGFGSEPAEPLLVKASTFFFDSVAERSGWTVTFVNVTDAVYQGYVSVSSSCARGVGAP
jgi:hypothetical protein